jgi:hypothetical protein
VSRQVLDAVFCIAAVVEVEIGEVCPKSALRDSTNVLIMKFERASQDSGAAVTFCYARLGKRGLIVAKRRKEAVLKVAVKVVRCFDK